MSLVVKRLYDVYSELTTTSMHLRVVTEYTLAMQMASNIPEYGGRKCIRSAIQQELGYEGSSTI